MKAVTWHGKRDVRVSEVPDPEIEEPTDALVRVTSAAICGSDLRLYEILSMFLDEGGHPRSRGYGHRRSGRLGGGAHADPDERGRSAGTKTHATHHLPLEEAPAAYEMFQEKRDNVIEVVLHP